MPLPARWLQPRSYHAFRCIGADCEDTCCSGWIVQIDRPTYETYQRCDDPDFGPRLRELVTINTAATNQDSYARITLSGTSCPFLSDGLCGIQNRFGESYLSIMCSSYPRIYNLVDDVLHRSLDVSCPEAARLVLLDPNPMEFDDQAGPSNDSRLGHLSVLRTDEENSGKPYRFFGEIRTFVIWLLQRRADSLWKRLAILGSFCEELQRMVESGQAGQIPDFLAACRDAVERDIFGPGLENIRPRPVEQLALVLDLIVARITSDFTPPRFLACYGEFKSGIAWTAQSSMNEIGVRYAAAFEQFYAPFLARHEHIFENYLVSYVHRTLFPLGPRDTNRQVSEHHAAHSIREQGMMLLVHYAIIQTVLVGLAAFHKNGMDAAHAVRVIQSSAKAFEHSLTFPARALELLAAANVPTCIGMAALLRMA